MSKPRYNWYYIAVKVLRNYPELLKRRRELQSAGVTYRYSKTPRARKMNRATEQLALKQLAPREEEDLDAVLCTIEDVGRQKNGDMTLRVVEMVDWNRTHTIAGAEMALGLTADQGKRMRRRLIMVLAKKLKYL